MKEPFSDFERLVARLNWGSPPHVVVIGVGHVGLRLCIEFARAEFRVTGLDVDEERVEQVRRGESYLVDIPTEEIEPLVVEGRLDATTDAEILKSADVAIICVPTPLSKTREPDIRRITDAVEAIALHQHSGMLVILESTTYPGTTNEVLVPKLTRGGFVLGRDVFVAFSPERVDPGNREYNLRNTPKVIGGATAECVEVASTLYSRIIDRVVPVSSPETAETVKLLENTFRAVNIALVNEMVMVSRRLGVDPFEVIRAASTKPFGFMPFYPGPGLGGHCIPIDPLYLSWKLKSLHFDPKFISLADSINCGMPAYVVQRLADCLNEGKMPIRGSRVLIYGVAYKPDINDARESPALGIIHELLLRGARVDYTDPFIPCLQQEGLDMKSVDESFAEYHAVVIVTHHSSLPKKQLLEQARLILDTRDALHGVSGNHTKVHGL